jgi:transcriptional regulator with XRE-family HTH domain
MGRSEKDQAMVESGASRPSPLTLAEKLNTLFDTVRDERGREYSNQRVAVAIGVSDAYIGYLRRGERTNPTKSSLEALAKFFGVSPEFFFDTAAAERVTEQLRQLRLLSRLRDAGALKVAMRLGGLSPRSLETVATMVDQLRELERLPAAPESDPDDPGEDR